MKKLLWVVVPVLSFAGPASAEVAIKGTLAAKGGGCYRGSTSVPFQAKVKDDNSVSGSWNIGGTDVPFQVASTADGFNGTRTSRTGEIQTISGKKNGDGYDVVVTGTDCTMSGRAAP